MHAHPALLLSPFQSLIGRMGVPVAQMIHFVRDLPQGWQTRRERMREGALEGNDRCWEWASLPLAHRELWIIGIPDLSENCHSARVRAVQGEGENQETSRRTWFAAPHTFSRSTGG